MLALRLGMSVAEAQRKIDSREFAEWMAFNRISPIGPERADTRAAIVANTVAQSVGAKTKVSDFLLDFEPPKPQTAEQQIALMKAIGAAFNAQQKSKGKQHGKHSKPGCSIDG